MGFLPNVSPGVLVVYGFVRFSLSQKMRGGEFVERTPFLAIFDFQFFVNNFFPIQPRNLIFGM